jgi:hypothetical protein
VPVDILCGVTWNECTNREVDVVTMPVMVIKIQIVAVVICLCILLLPWFGTRTKGGNDGEHIVVGVIVLINGYDLI